MSDGKPTHVDTQGPMQTRPIRSSSFQIPPAAFDGTVILQLLLSFVILLFLTVASNALAAGRSTELNRTNAPPKWSQQLASLDTVPGGLTASDWSSIRNQYE